MVGAFSFIFRVIRKSTFFVGLKLSRIRAYIVLRGNGVDFNKTLICNGVPIVDVHRTAVCKLGDNCSINSSILFNPIGRYSPTFLIVRENAKLIVGDNTGISSSAIVCHKEILIGNNVKLGGNVVIYDTDFHALDYITRRDRLLDRINAISKPVIIEDDVFIGAHTTILKGVTIGKGSIIGAASTVTKSIPSKQIWAGNPAVFIRNLDM